MKDSVIIIESPNKVAKIKEITGAKVFATMKSSLSIVMKRAKRLNSMIKKRL
ncbi:hypothetical protein HpMS63_07530 [Helicobacter pylori]